MRLFISGTGTGVGKTWLTRGLARALAAAGSPVVAIKPIETGCAPAPLDALALARACGRPKIATAEGLYRAEPPLAPHAVAMEGGPVVDFDAVVATTRGLIGSVAAEERGVGLVEGAGGLLVPLDAQRTTADLALALDLDLVLVARDELGVLSNVLTTASAAEALGLSLRAVVLSRHGHGADGSRRTNRQILAERLACPVLAFGPSPADTDDELAELAGPVLLAIGVAGR